MANPRKFSEKIALHHQKQAEETAAFEKIMREVSDATNKPDEMTLATQYGLPPGRAAGGTSPSRSPATQRGRAASSSVGPMRARPAERKHDTSPYGSSVYLSPPPDSSWRRTNSDSALHQSCGAGEPPPPTPSLSPHHAHYSHSHSHPHSHLHHHNHRRVPDNNLDIMAMLGSHQSRPRSSCEMPRVPGINVYESGGGGGGLSGGGLGGGELQVPGGSLPDLTHFAAPDHPYPTLPHRTSPDHHYHHHQSPSSPGALSPAGAGGLSPAGAGGLSPASGSPVGASVSPLGGSLHATLHSEHQPPPYDTQNHLSVPNSNSYLHHNKSMSPLEQSWMTSSYQAHCSPPSLHSSHSNINIPSPTMAHSPGSPAESPQQDSYYIQQALLQPFEQITMMDTPVSNYNTNYVNHSSPHTTTQHTYCQSVARGGARDCRSEVTRSERDPVAGGNGPLFPALTSPTTPTSIPDIILTDFSGEIGMGKELDGGLFGCEEERLREGLEPVDLDELHLLADPSALLPDAAAEDVFRLDRL